MRVARWNRRPERSDDWRLQLRRLYDELVDYADNTVRAAVTGAGAVEHVANWGNDDLTSDDAWYLGGTPWEAEKNYNEESAMWQMNKVRTPTHIVMGSKDIRVASAEGYLLERELHTLGMPSTLLIFPGEGHLLGNNPRHGRIKVREELQWLDQYSHPPVQQAGSK